MRKILYMLNFLLGIVVTSSNANSEEIDTTSEGSWLKVRQDGAGVCAVNITRSSNLKRSQKSRSLCKISQF